MFFCLGAGWPRDTSEPAARVCSMIYFHLNFCFLRWTCCLNFFAGFLLGRFTGKFTSWTIPLGSDIFSVSVESIMHRRVERRIRFGTRTSFKMNHFESDLRGRDIGRRLRLNGNLSGHSIFKQFKSPLIFNPISISCILFDSFFDGLQLWFWVQKERMNRSAANSRNARAGVSATMRGPLLFRDFATERLLWWN